MTASTCILVADDQPAVREALRILLTNAGYRVELATSPREVLRLIKEQEFALALLDLNYARDTTRGVGVGPATAENRRGTTRAGNDGLGDG